MFFGSNRLLAIDIGSRYIKIAEIDYSPKKSKLLKYAIALTPEGAFSGSEIENPDLIANTIRSMLQSQKIKTKQVVMAMSGSAVMVKKIVMPKVEKKLLNQQIRWEAEQYIPFDINQVALSYSVQNQKSMDDSLNVLIIAAQNSWVKTYRKLASLAGLDLQVLDIAGFALANAFEMCHGRVLDPNILIINVGAHLTQAVILKNNEVDFVRDISIGSHVCTLEIHKEMGLSIEEAESLKLGAGRGEEVPEEVFKFIDHYNQNLVEEIKNSIDYYFSSQGDSEQLGAIYITGGGSQMVGFRDVLASSLDRTIYSFEILSGFKSIDKSISLQFRESTPYAAIVMGLGSRKKGDK